jgi:hypothetical protein
VEACEIGDLSICQFEGGEHAWPSNCLTVLRITKMWKFRAVPALFAGLGMLSAPLVSSAGFSLSITIAPPVLQVYQQPLCPQDGYLWTPGYWGYGNAGYYWIAGAWVAPPQPGFLWTPGYWGYSNGIYAFNNGYWGPTVGFYGGVNYGFGYGGSGFEGGRWQGGHFAYNTAVSHVNTTIIHNTYNQAVPNHGNNRTSFNGGFGGISARPSAAETTTARQHGQPASSPAARTPQAAETHHIAANRTATPASPAPAQRSEAARPAPERPAARAPQAAEPRQIAANRTAAPARPAPAQRSEAVRPSPARPSPRAVAPARNEAPARSESPRPEGKAERH